MIKYIVTFCLVLISFSTKAQYWEEEKRPTSYDTVRSVFLVSDTTGLQVSTWAVKGYVIFIDQWIGEHFERDAQIPGHMEKRVVKYLLWNRQPFPKRYIIWDVK